jgi:hypothetical protein
MNESSVNYLQNHNTANFRFTDCVQHFPFKRTETSDRDWLKKYWYRSVENSVSDPDTHGPAKDGSSGVQISSDSQKLSSFLSIS